MKTKILLTFILTTFILSCNNTSNSQNYSSKSKTLNSKNSVTDQQLYYSYLEREIRNTKSMISSSKILLKKSLDSLEKLPLIKKIEVENTRLKDLIDQLDNLRSFGIDTPCIICPDGQICCPSRVLKDVILTSRKENFNLKGITRSGKLTNNVINKKDIYKKGNKTITPLNISKNLKALKVMMTDMNGKTITFDLNLNN